LYGQSARRIQSERRASGEFVHVEATPGYVKIVPAWKLDAVYCAGLKLGEPQVSLAALCALHELLVACESRQLAADDNVVTQEAQDGIAGTAHAKNAACSEAGVHAPDINAPARARYRRRAASGPDAGAAPSSSENTGPSPAGGKRHRKAGGRR
jgi:hypothetical protein